MFFFFVRKPDVYFRPFWPIIELDWPSLALSFWLCVLRRVFSFVLRWTCDRSLGGLELFALQRD